MKKIVSICIALSFVCITGCSPVEEIESSSETIASSSSSENNHTTTNTTGEFILLSDKNNSFNLSEGDTMGYFQLEKFQKSTLEEDVAYLKIGDLYNLKATFTATKIVFWRGEIEFDESEGLIFIPDKESINEIILPAERFEEKYNYYNNSDESAQEQEETKEEKFYFPLYLSKENIDALAKDENDAEKIKNLLENNSEETSYYCEVRVLNFQTSYINGRAFTETITLSSIKIV